MKRVVSSSIISVVILLLFAAAFFYFQIKKNVSTSLFKAVPSDAAFLISVNPSSGDLKRLANTSFFSPADSVMILKDWKRSLLLFDSLCNNEPHVAKALGNSPLLISGHVTGPSDFGCLFYCSVSANPEEVLSVLKRLFSFKGEVRTRTYNGVNIWEAGMESGEVLSWAVHKGLLIAGYTSFLVEDALRQQKNTAAGSPALSLESRWSEEEKGLMLALYYPFFSKWLKTQMDMAAPVDLLSFSHFGDWSVLQLDIHSNLIAYSGETLTGDSSSFISIFNRQQPVERKLADWLPAKTAAALIWGISDPVRFFESLHETEGKGSTSSRSPHENSFSEWMGEELALIITQPALSLTDNNFLAMISVKDSLKCSRSLEKLSGDAIEYYNGYTLRYIEEKALLKGLFGSLFQRVNRFYYTAINHHIVIGNQASVLRAYINDVKTGNMLKEEERYRSLSTHIPSRGNIFFYASIPQSVKVFADVASPAWLRWLSANAGALNNWNGLVFSLSHSNGLYQSSGCLGYFNTTARGPQLSWNAKLDTTLAAGPFFPAGIHGLILASDVNGQLYAFDISGDLKWKKKLDTPLMSDITAIDYYRNGGHQYLFNSHSFVYLLDSMGNNTGNYPYRLPAEASAGLTLVTADNPENDKFFIPCKNLRLYAYAITGKPLAGFSPVKLPELIIQPVFYNSDQQKMVFLGASGLCFVTDWNGRRLFTVKEKVMLREYCGFIKVEDKDDLLSYVSNEAKLMAINLNGEQRQIVSIQNDSVCSASAADLNGDAETDWIVAGNNGLSAKTKDGISLFKYNSGEVFDKVSVISSGSKMAVSALGEGRLYLFYRDGTIAEGFPFQGVDLPKFAPGSGKEDYLLLKEGPDNISLYLIPGK